MCCAGNSYLHHQFGQQGSRWRYSSYDERGHDHVHWYAVWQRYEQGVCDWYPYRPYDTTTRSSHHRPTHYKSSGASTKVNARITNLTAQQTAINLAISANPSDRMALRERVEVEDDLSKANFDLTEDIKVVLTMDKKAERSNIYRTHCKDKQRLIKNCGKVYMLTIGPKARKPLFQSPSVRPCIRHADSNICIRLSLSVTFPRGRLQNIERSICTILYICLSPSHFHVEDFKTYRTEHMYDMYISMYHTSLSITTLLTLAPHHAHTTLAPHHARTTPHPHTTLVHMYTTYFTL